MMRVVTMAAQEKSITGSLKYSSQTYGIGKRTIVAILHAISIAIPIAMVIRYLQLYAPDAA